MGAGGQALEENIRRGKCLMMHRYAVHTGMGSEFAVTGDLPQSLFDEQVKEMDCLPACRTKHHCNTTTKCDSSGITGC